MKIDSRNLESSLALRSRVLGSTIGLAPSWVKSRCLGR